MNLYLVVLLCVLVGYALYEVYYFKQTTEDEFKVKDLIDFNFGKKDKNMVYEILRIMHNLAFMGANKEIINNKVSKVILMRQMNIRPKELKSYILYLKDMKFIKEVGTSITITEVGIQFLQKTI